MAFLCPVRIRRNKKKKDGEEYIPQLGRITGSSSIETLVRVGLEKEAGVSSDSRMLVLHDFQPCVDDELEVKKGDLVSLLYRENDWAYVIDERRPLGQQNEGFIPYSYITPFLQDNNNKNTANRNKKLPREESTSTASASSNANSLVSATSTTSEIHPFFKDPSLGRFIVLYPFTARDENDIDVQRGELINVLNKDDPDWFWISREYDGQEGFVPSAFIYPLVVGLNNNNNINSNSNGGIPNGHHSHNSNNFNSYHHNHQSPPPLQQQQLQIPQSQQLKPSDPSTININNNLSSNMISATTSLPLGNPVHLLNNPVSPGGIASANFPYFNSRPKESIEVQSQAQNCAIASSLQQQLNSQPSSNSTALPSVPPVNGQAGEKAGTELIMLYDYKAQVGDDLSVRRGDWVYADLTCQPVEGWLWAYAPKQRKYGFVPSAYARPPAMTSL